MKDELILNENDNFSDTVIGKSIDSLFIAGTKGKAVADDEFANRLECIKGLARIRILRIERDSRLRNLQFIKLMPNIEEVFLYSARLESIDGLEQLKKVRFLEVDFGNKKRRILTALQIANVEKLSIWSPSRSDIENIASSATIQDLEFFRCKGALELERLRSLPLKYIRLEKGEFDELGDFTHLSELESLILIGCRNLRRFRGINHSLEVLIIESCNNIDVTSIQVFKGLKSLDLVGIKQMVPLSAFTGSAKLCNLSFQRCRVDVDKSELRAELPMLGELWISGLKKGQIVELSKSNPDVVVSNGRYTYRNGSEIEAYDFG